MNSMAPAVSEANTSECETAVIKESLRIGENITTRLPLISPIKPLQYEEWSIPPGVSFKYQQAGALSNAQSLIRAFGP